MDREDGQTKRQLGVNSLHAFRVSAGIALHLPAIVMCSIKIVHNNEINVIEGRSFVCDLLITKCF